MSKAYELQTAKQVERDRLQLLTGKFVQDIAEKTKASERLLASKGLATSGAAIKQFVDIRVAAMNQLITDVVALRKEMCGRVPGLTAAHELEKLQKALDEYVDGIERAVKLFVTSSPRGGGRASILSALPDYGAGLKQRIETELRILENESKLPKREAAGTIHINTGHGSNVVIGNVSNSILATLRNSRNDELSNRLLELTEAVQESNELAAEAKAAVLENLEFVVSQVAAEPATRQKTSVIQTVWNGLAPVLAVAANLAQIYSVVGPLLIKHLAA